MLKSLYQFLVIKLCRTCMITFWIVDRFEKHILTNLEYCFTVSMTAHSISVLSELKMSSFGPHAGAKTRSPSIALSTALCWRPCQMSNSSSTSWTRDWYTSCWTRQWI